MIPTLLGVTLLTFLLFNILGGDPALRFAGKHATPEHVQELRVEMGLDKPPVLQYFYFLKQIVTFDFGRSWSSRQNITGLFSEGLVNTLCLTAPPFILTVLFCVVLALVCVYYRGKLFDKTVVFICLVLLSTTSLMFIMMTQYFLSYKWGIFPISGWDPSWIGRWQYLMLPWIILFILDLGPSVLIYRGMIQNEVFQDYVRTAKAKGVSNQKIYLKHVLKNALIPIITIVVIQIPFLITGAVLVESYFGLPGLGGTIIKALSDSDFPVIKMLTVLTAILYMFFNLLSDIICSLVDPRIKLS